LVTWSDFLRSRKRLKKIREHDEKNVHFNHNTFPVYQSFNKSLRIKTR
jgi:hypothetical protein